MMRKSTLPVFLMLLGLWVTAGLSLTSCNKEKKIYLPVQLSEGGAWIFINDKGERVGSQEWEFQPSISQDGIFTASSEDGLTVYRWDGDEAKPIDSLTNLVSVGILADGLMPVTPQMQRIRIVDSKGKLKFVLEPIDGQEVTSCADKFSEGLLIINTVDGKAGVINKKGDLVVKPKYSEISNFKDGFALAVDYNYDDYETGPKYFILDKEGNEKAIAGEFGYGEGDCFDVSEFQDGVVYVYGKPVEEEDNYEFPLLMISTDGKVTKVGNGEWVSTLDFGGKLVNNYGGETSSHEWIDKEGKTVMKITGDDGWLSNYGNFVVLNGKDLLTVFDSLGKEIAKITGNVFPMWGNANFGLVYSENDSDYSGPSIYKILDKEGKPLNDTKYYGVGTLEMISPNNSKYEDDMCGNSNVTSAYVDVTAAASKLAQMITEGVKGKSYYYIGESVADILSGENAKYFSGSSRSFSLPTDSTYYLANGAGFWIDGTGEASTDIVAPTYQNYFEVHHYDYYGRAWGWNRTRQVGVHFNKSAKVVAFNLKLRTNHASGTRLREALERRLKNDGYTVTRNEPNYEELTNGYRNVIIYGNKESNGVGAIVFEKDGYKKSDDAKAALAADLTY